LLSIAVALLLQVPAWSQGCALCQTALTSSPEGRAVAGSFRQGILLLLAVPYSIAGIAGLAYYRARQKAKRNENRMPL
jgi:hypothetical protein